MQTLESSLIPLIEKIGQVHGWPELQFKIDEAWGSNRKDNRLALRKALSLKLNEDLTELSRPPLPISGSASVSHCPSIGGFVFVPKPWSAGFDIEEKSRISEKVVSRIASPEETTTAPNRHCLWVAKEATFKSLMNKNQPRVLSEIMITGWTSENLSSLPSQHLLNAWTYSAMLKRVNSSISGIGLAVSFRDNVLSIFVGAHST